MQATDTMIWSGISTSFRLAFVATLRSTQP